MSHLAWINNTIIFMKVYLQILKVMRFSLRQGLFAIYLVRLRDTHFCMYCTCNWIMHILIVFNGNTLAQQSLWFIWFTASECLDCERPGFYSTMYCPRIKTGDMCYIKVVHNDTGIFTIKGYSNLLLSMLI